MLKQGPISFCRLWRVCRNKNRKNKEKGKGKGMERKIEVGLDLN